MKCGIKQRRTNQAQDVLMGIEGHQSLQQRTNWDGQQPVLVDKYGLWAPGGEMKYIAMVTAIGQHPLYWKIIYSTGGMLIIDDEY